jgi:hypothetical protein
MVYKLVRAGQPSPERAWVLLKLSVTYRHFKLCCLKDVGPRANVDELKPQACAVVMSSGMQSEAKEATSQASQPNVLQLDPSLVVLMIPVDGQTEQHPNASAAVSVNSGICMQSLRIVRSF